jgi:hypothetical protein
MEGNGSSLNLGYRLNILLDGLRKAKKTFIVTVFCLRFEIGTRSKSPNHSAASLKQNSLVLNKDVNWKQLVRFHVFE